jgi:hypothetical protein
MIEKALEIVSAPQRRLRGLARLVVGLEISNPSVDCMQK